MSHESSPTRVLVIEPNADLRELEETILTYDGYRVETPSPNADPADIAAWSRPDVIVLGIPHPGESRSWHLLDQLQANPQTRIIPVVVISTSEPAVARAQTAPVVGSSGNTVVAPYDIVDLEKAVANALKNPPPAAVLPPSNRQPSRAEAIAGNALDAHGRQVAVQTIERLRNVEPYASRFAELTKDLVDDIGMMVGAIADGLLRGLPPRPVFDVRTIRQAIHRHVLLRKSQGLGTAAAVREDLVLRDEIDHFVQGLVGQDGFTAQDARDVSEKVHAYIAELARIIGEDFAATETP